MAYRALEELLAGRRQVVEDFKAGRIKSAEAREKLKDFDERIKEEERRHKKAVENYHQKIRGRNRKWES